MISCCLELLFARPYPPSYFSAVSTVQVNRKKNRPQANDWFWAEVLRTLPKAEAKFRKQYPDAPIPSAAQWKLWFPSVLQLANDPEVVQPADWWLEPRTDPFGAEIREDQIRLHTDFVDCYRFFPDYTLFMMQFVRERIRQIKRHPLRNFLLRHRGGNFLAKGNIDGSLAKGFNDIAIPGVKFTSRGLKITGDMTFEQWKAGLRTLLRLADATNETAIATELNQLRAISKAEEKEIVDAIERESGKPIAKKGRKSRKEIYHAVREELRRLKRLPKSSAMQKNLKDF